MLNKSPIILNCFSRGGSNILWNLFLTHPDLCSPIWETLQIFSLNPRAPRWEGLVTAMLGFQTGLFNQWRLNPRKSVSNQCKSFIDRTLWNWKLKTYTDPEMKYRYEDQPYTLEEVKASRLVIKNNNGLTFLSDMFAETYPDAAFIALVRHPVPLYESHRRRKTPVSKSIDHFANYYIKMTDRMLTDADRFKHYHIVKFEDLLLDHVSSIKQLYKLANLKLEKIEKVRLKAKPFTHADGSYRTDYESGRHYWFSFEEVHRMLEPNVNKHQEERLEKSEQQELEKRLGSTLSLLEYADHD